MTVRTLLCCLAMAAATFVAPFPAQAQASLAFAVDSTADEVDAAPGDGVCATAARTCSLRAAIMEAASHPGEHATVVLPAGRFTITRPPSTSPVTLTSPADGPLNLYWPITIRGAGARDTIIDGNGLDRIFTVPFPGTAVEISDVTLTGGVATERELLLVTGGGAIANQGELTLRRVTVTGNRADYGGGVFNTPSASAEIFDSTISGNVANLEGGGIRFDAYGLVVNSTISGNTVLATCCGELESYPGSRVGEGGGIDIRGAGPVTIVNSTIVGNHAVIGGGGVTIATGYQGALGPVQGVGGPLWLRNTIIAGNSSDAGPANCSRTIARIVSLGRNIEDGDSCELTAAGDRPRTEPLLLPLADNGGPTDTHAPRPTSPAVDAAADCPPADQRGVLRPQGGACDVGSIERR